MCYGYRNELVLTMTSIGNALANSIWENNTKNRVKPTSTSSRCFYIIYSVVYLCMEFYLYTMFVDIFFFITKIKLLMVVVLIVAIAIVVEVFKL